MSTAERESELPPSCGTIRFLLFRIGVIHCTLSHIGSTLSLKDSRILVFTCPLLERKTCNLMSTLFWQGGPFYLSSKQHVPESKNLKKNPDTPYTLDARRPFKALPTLTRYPYRVSSPKSHLDAGVKSLHKQQTGEATVIAYSLTLGLEWDFP